MARHCPECNVVITPSEIVVLAARRHTAATFVGSEPRKLPGAHVLFHSLCWTHVDLDEWQLIAPSVRAADVPVE